MAADDAWCPRGAEDLGVASSVGGLWARNAASRPSSRCVAEYSSAAGAEAGRLSWGEFDAAALAQCRNAARASAAVGAGAFAGPDPPPTLAFLPNFHVIGFVLNFVLPAFLGAPCATHAECESSPLSLALLLDAAAALGPATVDTVPALLEDLARRPDLAAAARPFVGPAVAYGGAPLAPWAAAKLRAAGVRAFSQYGATEHGGPLLVGAAGDALGAMRGTGGCDLVLDADGYRSPDVLEGELQGSKRLVVLGCAYVTPGYLGAPAPSPPFEAERRTGDVFRRVESAGGAAFAYVCRRDDLLVLSSGELANPLPLEARLAAELPPDVRACVIGQGRTSPVVVVSKRVPRAALARACAAANRAAESYARVAPDRAVFLDDGEPWPTNAKGVVVRGALEAAARDRADALDEVHVVGDGDDDDASSDDAAPGPDLRGAILDEVEALTGHRLGADAPLLGARGLSSSGVFALSRPRVARLRARARSPAPSRAAARRGRPPPSSARAVGRRGRRGRGALLRRRRGGAAVVAPPPRWGAAPGAVPLARWAAPPPDARRLRAAAYGTFFADASTLFAFDGGAGLGLGPAEARVADPQTFLVLEAGGQVLEASGALAGGEKRVGVFTAFMGGDAASLRGPVAVPVGAVNSPYELSGCGASTVGARLSYAFALTGPAAAVDTACSSSLAAARMALQEIRDGACAFAALVAPNLMLDGRYPHAGLAIIGMLSPRGRCHALDDRADGFLRCEGSAAFALVPDGDASSTAPPAVLGLGLGHNGHAASFLAPNGAAQRRCVDAARRDAGPGGAYASLELHGTGTALGDPVEIGGLAAAGESGALALSGVKATLGHAESCAGCAGLGDALLAAARGEWRPQYELARLHGASFAASDAGPQLARRRRRRDRPERPRRRLLLRLVRRPRARGAPAGPGPGARARARAAPPSRGAPSRAVPCRDWCAQKRRWVAAQGARGAAPAAPAARRRGRARRAPDAPAASPRSSRALARALPSQARALRAFAEALAASGPAGDRVAVALGARAVLEPVRAAAVFAPGARARRRSSL
ncbi:phosphopantetheine binding protein [Aureococcus anophagefferens]|uniref:Phosphopantetheine binding protein n=1 Tax=Aureococcus anophagefferens TaxID=44056 RepID=A0ABR1G2V2_AURAN